MMIIIIMCNMFTYTHFWCVPLSSLPLVKRVTILMSSEALLFNFRKLIWNMINGCLNSSMVTHFYFPNIDALFAHRTSNGIQPSRRELIWWKASFTHFDGDLDECGQNHWIGDPIGQMHQYKGFERLRDNHEIVVKDAIVTDHWYWIVATNQRNNQIIIWFNKKLFEWTQLSISKDFCFFHFLHCYHFKGSVMWCVWHKLYVDRLRFKKKTVAIGIISLFFLAFNRMNYISSHHAIIWNLERWAC